MQKVGKCVLRIVIFLISSLISFTLYDEKREEQNTEWQHSRWESPDYDGGEFLKEGMWSYMYITSYNGVTWTCYPTGGQIIGVKTKTKTTPPTSFWRKRSLWHSIPNSYPTQTLTCKESWNIKMMEVKPHVISGTPVYAEHFQLCTLTPFQGVGRPINTTLQGLRDRARSHKMLSGDRYTLVCLFLSSGYCFSLCLPSWKVRMVTFPQQDPVGLSRVVTNLRCFWYFTKFCLVRMKPCTLYLRAGASFVMFLKFNIV